MYYDSIYCIRFSTYCLSIDTVRTDPYMCVVCTMLVLSCDLKLKKRWHATPLAFCFSPTVPLNRFMFVYSCLHFMIPLLLFSVCFLFIISTGRNFAVSILGFWYRSLCIEIHLWLCFANGPSPDCSAALKYIYSFCHEYIPTWNHSSTWQQLR